MDDLLASVVKRHILTIADREWQSITDEDDANEQVARLNSIAEAAGSRIRFGAWRKRTGKVWHLKHVEGFDL